MKAEVRQSYMWRLEDDYRQPEVESSEKESNTIFVFARKRIIDPAEVETLSKFLTCPPFGTHEREAFSGSLEVHMQPLQKIVSHNKSPR